MKPVNRRTALTLSLAAPVAGSLALPGGGSVDSCFQGMNIRIGWATSGYWPDKSFTGWHVLAPDLESMEKNYIPGHVIPTKWVPFEQWLKELEEIYGLGPRA